MRSSRPIQALHETAFDADRRPNGAVPLPNAVHDAHATLLTEVAVAGPILRAGPVPVAQLVLQLGRERKESRGGEYGGGSKGGGGLALASDTVAVVDTDGFRGWSLERDCAALASDVHCGGGFGRFFLQVFFFCAFDFMLLGGLE